MSVTADTVSMDKSRRRRLVGTFSTETSPESGQELVKLPGKRAARESRSSPQEQRPEPSVAGPTEPPEPKQTRGVGGQAPVIADPEIAGLPALTNDQIEDRVRRLAGPCLSLIERLTADVIAGRKPPRSVQSVIGNAQWVIEKAWRVAKAAESAESAKQVQAKLDKARKAFGSAGVLALNTELQARLASERSGDSH